MNLLEILELIIKNLRGTVFEPWVNLLLFSLLLAIVLFIISFLIGKKGRKYISELAKNTKEKIDNSTQYAPELQSFTEKISPYIEITIYAFMSFIGFFSGSVVSIVLAFTRDNAPLLAQTVAAIWIIASFIFMRINIASASWAYHKIKNKQR